MDRSTKTSAGPSPWPEFRDASLQTQALTHRSFGSQHYERLEFLGDSVLNLIVSRMLIERFPGHAEGELSRIRAHLVRQERLVQVASEIGLQPKIRLGEGEIRGAEGPRPSIVADVLEALMGALYLDQGFEACESWVRSLFLPLLNNPDLLRQSKDAKTRLQEWTQARAQALPEYSVVATLGAAHNQTFRVVCRIDKPAMQAEGEGPSRRAAEQAAAEQLCQRLVHP